VQRYIPAKEIKRGWSYRETIQRGELFKEDGLQVMLTLLSFCNFFCIEWTEVIFRDGRKSSSSYCIIDRFHEATAWALGVLLNDEGIPTGQISVICGCNKKLANKLSSIDWKIHVKV